MKNKILTWKYILPAAGFVLVALVVIVGIKIKKRG